MEVKIMNSTVNIERKHKWIVLIAVVLAAFLLSSLPVYANELAITDKFVDSNQWTYVGSATKSVTSSYASVKITVLKKSNGTASNYEKLKVKATSTGIAYTATRTEWKDILIPSAYRAAGKSIAYYCEGNDPALDCLATGYFNSH
jgi:hypothetical protein